MTYFLTYGFLLVARFAGLRRSTQKLYWPIFFGLFLFAAIRFEVGCDWANYILNFEQQALGTLDTAVTQVNPAHWVLLEIMDTLGLEYYWLNVATSAIFFAGVHTMARRTPEPLAVLVLAFPILILNMPMSAVKQAAAIGLVCFAFNAFSDRKVGLFLLFLALAALFHSSAIAFLVILPFIFGQFSRQNIGIAAAMALPLFAVVLTSDAAELATTRYIENDIDAGGAIFRSGVLIATGLLFFTQLMGRWQKQMPDNFKLMALLSGGMVILAPMMLASTVIADRFGYYLFVPALVIYASLPKLMPEKSKALIRAAPYVLISIVFVGWTQFSAHYAFCYLPYSTVIGQY